MNGRDIAPERPIRATSAGPVFGWPWQTCNRADLQRLWLALAGLVFALVLTGCVPEERVVATSRIYAVDGDTIKIGDETYRLIGYDTPETYRAECAEEKALGDKATRRLRDLLTDADEATLLVRAERDRYGRGLAILKIAGQDVGTLLIGEGLARAYDGGTRRGWC